MAVKPVDQATYIKSSLLASELRAKIDGMQLSGGLLGPDGPASHGRRLAERLVDAAVAGA